MSRTRRNRDHHYHTNKHVHANNKLKREINWRYNLCHETVSDSKKQNIYNDALLEWVIAGTDSLQRSYSRRGLKEKSNSKYRANQAQQLFKIMRIHEVDEHMYDPSDELISKGMYNIYY